MMRQPQVRYYFIITAVTCVDPHGNEKARPLERNRVSKPDTQQTDGGGDSR